MVPLETELFCGIDVAALHANRIGGADPATCGAHLFGRDSCRHHKQLLSTCLIFAATLGLSRAARAPATPMWPRPSRPWSKTRRYWIRDFPRALPFIGFSRRFGIQCRSTANRPGAP